MNRRRIISLLLFFLLTLGLCASAGQAPGGVEVLLGKARSLEARGRMDLAIQNWRQVLLVNPNQMEALAGLARYAKQNGDAEAERGYLNRMRKINPKDPAIAAVEKMRVITPQQRSRLDEAGRLAMQHKPDEAMRIYHEVFGDEPPSGKWAEPFYETEAASTGGREKAITQLRQLSTRAPNNEVYRLWLARVLSYDPKTRMEGFRLFETIKDPGTVEQARTTWRQALLWEKENMVALGSLDAYLQRYPDPELEKIRQSLQEKQEHATTEANKEHGFQALRSKDLPAAEARFEEVLRRSPNDANAIAGLAFVRLNQKRFDDALNLFGRARELAPQRADIREGYDTAKFLSAMQQGSTALEQNRPEIAIAAYNAALSMQPSNQQALLGTAQALVRERKFSDAESRFKQVLSQDPNNAEATAGLGFIRLNQQKFDDAANLLGEARRLNPNRTDVNESYRTAKFWAVMKQGEAALSQNHTDTAIANYQQALTLNPGSKDALLGLALAEDRKQNYAQSIQAYTQLTAANPADVQSWLGLMKAQIAAKNPQAAITTSQRIPPAAKQQIEARPDYLAEMAQAYYKTNHPAEGDQLLRRALDAANRSDSEQALSVRLEIAGALMDQGKPDRALDIYQHATASHPDNVLAWQGLVGAYARTRDFTHARAAVRSMPQASYEGANKDPGFLNSVAAIYSAGGQCGEAEDFLNRSLALDKAAGRQPAENTRLQLADIWLREGNYERAASAYHELTSSNQNSVEAWRGYITSLHEKHDDRSAVGEAQRIPTAVRTRLEANPDFLTLLASANSTLGQHHQTVLLLQQARSHLESQGKIPPAALDLQLAWAMLADAQPGQDPRELLWKTRTRTDLTGKQRAAIDEIWSTWSIRKAEQAWQAKEPTRAVTALMDAQRELPNNPRIHAALASVYMRQRQFPQALEVYRSWGMAGAEAADYRAAAGAALAAHKTEIANQFMQEGLQHFPNDPELLRMTAKQAVSRGKYDEAESYLKTALAATRQQPLNNAPKGPTEEPNSPAVQNEALPGSGGVDSAMNLLTPSPEMPNCRSSARSNTPGDLRIKPISAVSVDSDEPVNPQKEQQIQDEIDVVQNRNTPFVDLGDVASGRAGDPGIDRLIIEDGILGASVTANNEVRFGLEAHGIYLYSGTPDGHSKSQFGTLAPGVTFGQQATAGVTGELQLSTPTFGLDFGATPQQFPVPNFTGGLRFRPLNGPITFLATRDSVKDSLLSYAGIRDPGSGIIWGGVVSNTGTLQFDHKDRRGGQYASGSFSYLTGKNVPNNWEVSANAGLYFTIVKGLAVGLNANGMHYDRNLSFFSLGQGGYFSPQQYGLASIPISWFSRHKRFEYEIRASLGAQYFSQDSSPFFPARVNAILPPQGSYRSETHTGPNYSFALRLGYRIAPHVYFDTFATANNARNYATQTVGFSLKFLAHRLPTNTDLHVNSIPDWRGNQPFAIE
jgi:tetratricopeptide (TPR) repeat protein